jgi:hypothetical protein
MSMWSYWSSSPPTQLDSPVQENQVSAQEFAAAAEEHPATLPPPALPSIVYLIYPSAPSYKDRSRKELHPQAGKPKRVHYATSFADSSPRAAPATSGSIRSQPQSDRLHALENKQEALFRVTDT